MRLRTGESVEETENLAYEGGEGSMEVRKWNAVNEWIGLYLAQPAQTQQTMNKMYLDKHLFFIIIFKCRLSSGSRRSWLSLISLFFYNITQLRLTCVFWF